MNNQSNQIQAQSRPLTGSGGAAAVIGGGLSRAPSIGALLGGLHEVLECQRAEIAAIADRISPILGPDYPMVNPPTQTVGDDASHVAQRLSDAIERIAQQTAVLFHLKTRCQVDGGASEAAPCGKH